MTETPLTDPFVHIELAGLDVPTAHGYLLGAVGPRPIAWASTIDVDGRPNLAPFSYFNVFSTKPPLVIFSPNRTGRTNAVKDTYTNVKAVPEVVINTVTYGLVQQCNLTSAAFAQGVNEFEKAGLTPLPSERVRPARVAESPVQLECLVLKVEELGAHGGAGNLVFCEVLMLHVHPAVLDDEGRIDPRKLDFVGRMGGPYYTRASSEAVFAVQRGNPTEAIGIDGLPEALRTSTLLTGNELAQLAVQPALPSAETVSAFAEGPGSQILARAGTRTALHEAVRAHLATGDAPGALLLALAGEIRLAGSPNTPENA